MSHGPDVGKDESRDERKVNAAKAFNTKSSSAMQTGSGLLRIESSLEKGEGPQGS